MTNNNTNNSAQKSHRKIRENVKRKQLEKRLEEDVNLIKNVMKGMDKMLACGGFHCRETREKLNALKKEQVKKLVNQVNVVARDRKGQEPVPYKKKAKTVKGMKKELGEALLELDEYKNHHNCLVRLCNGYLREFIDHMRTQLQNYYMSQKNDMPPERRRLLHQIFFAINEMSFRGDSKSQNANATKMITRKDAELYTRAMHLFRMAMSY